jgi:NAD(P)-dependent dehydrogenase (short-subunit alcohol dehydrogenase family)
MSSPKSAKNVLHTRVALVTGSAQGIGRAIALRLASDGLDVAVADLHWQPKLDALACVVKEIVDLGRKSVAVTGDVSKEEDVKAMVNKVVSELGRLDVVRLACPRCIFGFDVIPPTDGCQCR